MTINSKEKIFEYSSELIACILLTSYFLIDAYVLWKIKLFGFGISSMIDAGLTVLFGILVFLRFRDGIQWFEISLLALIVILGWTASRYDVNRWYQNFDVYRAFFAVGIGVTITRKPMKGWVFWIPLFVTLGAILINYFIFGKTADGGIVFGMNRNTFPVINVSLGMLATLNYYAQNKQRSPWALLIPVLVVGFNFYSMGRAGIIVAMGYLVVVAIDYFLGSFKKLSEPSSKKILIGTIVIVSVGILILIVAFEYALRNTRLATEKLSDSGRSYIYKEFFNSYTWKSNIFGFPLNKMKMDDHYHNSFMQVIARSGIFGWIAIGLYVRSLWQFLRHKKVFFFLGGLLAIYSMVAYSMFISHGDLILFSSLVYANSLATSNKKSRENESESK